MCGRGADRLMFGMNLRRVLTREGRKVNFGSVRAIGTIIHRREAIQTGMLAQGGVEDTGHCQ